MSKSNGQVRLPRKNKCVDNILILGRPEYKLLITNVDIVRNDAAVMISQVYINDLVWAFEASGYEIIKRDDWGNYIIGKPDELLEEDTE